VGLLNKPRIQDNLSELLSDDAKTRLQLKTIAELTKGVRGLPKPPTQATQQAAQAQRTGYFRMQSVPESLDYLTPKRTSPTNSPISSGLLGVIIGLSSLSLAPVFAGVGAQAVQKKINSKIAGVVADLYTTTEGRQRMIKILRATKSDKPKARRMLEQLMSVSAKEKARQPGNEIMPEDFDGLGEQNE